MLHSLLLCLLSITLITAQQTYIIVGTSGTSSYTISTPAGVTTANPSITAPAGSKITFQINIDNSAHPFGLSTSSSASVSALGLTPSSVGGCVASGSNAYIRPSGVTSCTLEWIVPAVGTTVYYRCSRHSPMNNRITITPATSVVVDPTPTTQAPTTATPTTAAPTTPAASTFIIAGTTGTSSYTIVTAAGVSAQNPVLNVVAGTRVVFRIDIDNSAHPFGLTTSSSSAVSSLGLKPTATGGCELSGTAAYILPDNLSSCTLEWIVPAVGTNVFYRCSRHSSMNNRIIISSTDVPTTETPTTPAPTTQAPTQTPTTQTPTTQTPTTQTPTDTTTPAPVARIRYIITGTTGTSSYTIDTPTVIGGRNPALSVPAGSRVIFQINIDNSAHPFGLSTSSSASVSALGLTPTATGGCVASGSNAYIRPSGVTSCTLEWIAPAAGTNVFYRCSRHSGMNNRITITAVATASPTGSSTTTSPPIGVAVATATFSITTRTTGSALAAQQSQVAQTMRTVAQNTGSDVLSSFIINNADITKLTQLNRWSVKISFRGDNRDTYLQRYITTLNRSGLSAVRTAELDAEDSFILESDVEISESVMMIQSCADGSEIAAIQDCPVETVILPSATSSTSSSSTTPIAVIVAPIMGGIVLLAIVITVAIVAQRRRADSIKHINHMGQTQTEMV